MQHASWIDHVSLGGGSKPGVEDLKGWDPFAGEIGQNWTGEHPGKKQGELWSLLGLVVEQGLVGKNDWGVEEVPLA